MKHLSDSRLMELAEKINQELDFTVHDRRDMLHIGACEECYRMLRTLMAFMDVTDHIGMELAVERKIAAETSTVIRVVVVNMVAAMEQLQSSRAAWAFCSQLPAQTRSDEDEETPIAKMEDVSNSNTFVAYDPEDKMLVVQLDAGDVSGEPWATVKYSDGTTREIPLEKRGGVYWGQITDLDEGEYEVILQK